MADKITKIVKSNFLPTTFEGRLPVYAERFNALVESLTNLGITDDGIILTKSNVTQTTAITTGVTTTAYAGVITTVSSTLAAGSNASFTVTNPNVKSTSVIQLTEDDSATAGIAKANIQTIADGSFVINITNIHGTNAFNNVVKIHYLIV